MPGVHVVFSAECNHALSWQSVGIFHSHKAAKQPGPITRLLACSDEQLQTYRGLDIGPTFVHHNMRFGHPLIDEVGYPSYNKPASVMFWLEQVDVQEEFIALLDTDMQLREPLDPVALGARRGVVVSAEYSYLVGTQGKFARRFLEPHEVPLAARCGGFHIFHREDLRVIAPLWVEFTKRVRAFAKQDMETYAAAIRLSTRTACTRTACRVRVRVRVHMIARAHAHCRDLLALASQVRLGVFPQLAPTRRDLAARARDPTKPGAAAARDAPEMYPRCSRDVAEM